MRHYVRLSLILCLLSFQAWAESFWVTKAGAGAADGTSLANAWANTVTVGSGAGQFGRGDTLYVCGTEAAPVDATITVASVGAFDGTVNSTADIVEITGIASQCGGSQGWIGAITGNAIIASSQAAIKVHDLYIRDVTASGVSQLMGAATTACAITASFPCGCSDIYNITGYRVSTASGNLASLQASGNTDFPASAVPGVCGRNNTGYDIGGSTYRKRLNTANALIEGNVDYRGGGVSNSWPIYAAGVVVNCGVANSGAGVTWTQLAGTIHYTTQTSCGAASGAVIIGVDVGSPVAGSAQILALNAGCTTNGTCGALAVGSYGINTATNTVWINKGNTPLATAAVDLIYARATGTRMANNESYDADDAFDGTGMGIDFGETNGVMERNYSVNSPTYAFSTGRGNTGTVIRSSIAQDPGTAGFLAVGQVTIDNVASSGVATLIDALVYTGETLTVRNSGGSGLATLVNDSLAAGTVTTATNSIADPGFVGGASPTNREGFRLTSDSALRNAGTGLNLGSVLDCMGNGFPSPPDIGACGTNSGAAAAPRTARTTATAR